jgi:hypothetical protein
MIEQATAYIPGWLAFLMAACILFAFCPDGCAALVASLIDGRDILGAAMAVR